MIPVRMVDFQGVRYFSCTAPKKDLGKRPSRAMASQTRGWLSIMTRSTEVMPVSAPRRDQELRPGQSGLSEGVRDRRIDVDLVVAAPCPSGLAATAM